MNINFKQLTTAGYIIIPEFLTSEEVSMVANEYQLSLTDNENKNYDIARPADKSKVSLLYPKIKRMLRLIAMNSDIYTDTLISAGYFSNERVQFTWHQDHEPYYKWQDSYHSLNFWIPIIKPDPNQSGLDVVSFESLLKSDPVTVKTRLIGKGAQTFVPQGTTTLVNNQDSGGHFNLSVNIDDIKHTPSIRPGDLLLMRQDLIHQTQIPNSVRVALSVRAINSTHVIHKDKFYETCDRKETMINNNKLHYDDVINMFRTCNSCYIKDVLTKGI
jgi:hypothetical protein